MHYLEWEIYITLFPWYTQEFVNWDFERNTAKGRHLKGIGPAVVDPDKIPAAAGLKGHLLIGIIYISRINVVKIYGTSWEL